MCSAPSTSEECAEYVVRACVCACACAERAVKEGALHLSLFEEPIFAGIELLFAVIDLFHLHIITH
jgi:hypothetical protein